MKPTPEQYRDAALALIRAGVPLDARSGPGEHVQQMTPADGNAGAFVEVFVWVPEELTDPEHREAAATRAPISEELSIAADRLNDADRLERLTHDEPLPDGQVRRRPRQPTELL